MKLNYVNNIPLAHGEVTVVISNNASSVAKHSWELAAGIQKVGMGVLLINCGMSKGRFNEFEETTLPQPNTGKPKHGQQHLVVHSSVRGDLAGERDAIAQKVRECGIGVVIISGWEWSSSSYRRKQRLLFNLRELMEDEDVVIVIYSQARTEPIAGEYDRGGLGWLSMLAVEIVRLEASDDLKKTVSKPPPLVVLPKDIEESERSAQLLASKINNLEGEKSIVDGRSSIVGERKNMGDKKPMKNEKKTEKKGADEPLVGMGL
ncbi:MAG: hypothetical protein ACHQM6_00120 [Candidatus Kapaibacterium sp.]